MAIQIRNKRRLDFGMATMADLVFLLLIFFMLTSTLVSPNAINVLLPSSESNQRAQQTITIYINEQYNYFIGEKQVREDDLENRITRNLSGKQNGTIVLRSDKTVPIQYVVNVIDAVNKVNKRLNTKHKVILATKPKN
ncbi:MAG: biopolymer transporter ExbD [Bacteroidales bacterium]|nr:biopolymer transporter ExbD [Bacteroidales bacterium]